MTPRLAAFLDVLAVAYCAAIASASIVTSTAPWWLRIAACVAFSAIAGFKAWTIARNAVLLTEQRDRLCERLCDQPRRISNVVNISEARS